MHPFQRIARRAAALVLLLVGAALPAAAAKVPVSALSASLAMDPILVESPSLVFLFSSRAADLPAQLLVSVEGNYGYFEDGLGAIARPEQHAVFGLSQPGYWPTSGASFVQAGWGMRSEGWRLGIAVRGSQSRDESSRRTVSEDYDGDIHVEAQASQYRTTRVEAGASAGLRTRSLDVDLAVDLLRHDQTISLARAQWYEGASDTFAAGIETSGDLSPTVTARARAVLGNGYAFVAASSWSEFRTEWDGWQYRARHQNANEDWEITPLDVDLLGRSWYAGAALLAATRTIDEVAVSASFAHEEQPSLVGGYSSVSNQRSTYRTAAVGVSLRKGVLENLEAQAGARVAYGDTKIRRLSDDEDRRSSEDREQSDALTESFACGLTYAWKRVRLAGTLALPPRTSEPLSRIDIRVLL